MPARKHTTLGDWFLYGIFRFTEFLLILLKVQTVFSLGEFLGRLVFRLPLDYRKTVLRNLRLAFRDELSADEIEVLAERVFELTGANLLSSLRIPFLTDAQIEEVAKVRNLDLLTRLEGRENGMVVLLPHMGNWELLAQTMTLFSKTVPGARGGTHYRPLHNAPLNRLIERRRRKRGIELFSKRTSLHSLVAFLREGNGLAILADQRIGRRGEVVDFFGLPTDCSPLPALLAKRSGAAILTVHCETVGRAEWELVLSPVEGRDTAACMKSIELAWRSSPADVFWFQDRWRYQIKHGHVEAPPE